MKCPACDEEGEPMIETPLSDQKMPTLGELLLPRPGAAPVSLIVRGIHACANGHVWAADRRLGNAPEPQA